MPQEINNTNENSIINNIMNNSIAKKCSNELDKINVDDIFGKNQFKC